MINKEQQDKDVEKKLSEMSKVEWSSMWKKAIAIREARDKEFLEGIERVKPDATQTKQPVG